MKTRAYLKWNLDTSATQLTVVNRSESLSLKQAQDLCMRISEQAKINPNKYDGDSGDKVKFT